MIVRLFVICIFALSGDVTFDPPAHGYIRCHFESYDRDGGTLRLHVYGCVTDKIFSWGG